MDAGSAGFAASRRQYALCVVPSPGWGYNSITGPDWCNPMYEVPYIWQRETYESLLKIMMRC